MTGMELDKWLEITRSWEKDLGKGEGTGREDLISAHFVYMTTLYP